MVWMPGNASPGQFQFRAISGHDFAFTLVKRPIHSSIEFADNLHSQFQAFVVFEQRPDRVEVATIPRTVTPFSLSGLVPGL